MEKGKYVEKVIEIFRENKFTFKDAERALEEIKLALGHLKENSKV